MNKMSKTKQPRGPLANAGKKPTDTGNTGKKKFERILKNKYWVAGIVLGLIAVTILLVITINMFGHPSQKANSALASTAPTTALGSASGIQTVAKEGNTFDALKDVVVIEMKDGGIIKLELYPDKAPITVANFVKLVNSDFYNGLKFHRVMKGFMIQGGDPKGNGTGGSSTKIKGEFSNNGVNNTLSHTRGVISMARSTGMNTASSQFFIMHKDTKSLDGDYAAFGKVIEGMDVVDAIANVKCDMSNPQSPVPLVDQIMKDVRIETRIA